MSELLTQEEANSLIDMPKVRKSDEKYPFPLAGKILNIPILSQNGSENFLIDVNRGKIRITKCTYQERFLEEIILLRLDIDGPPHGNPDVENPPLLKLEPFNGKIIDCPHLHLYVEGYMDKWAIPAPNDKFSDTNDVYKTLNDFFDYCNIIEKPVIWRESLHGY